MSFGTGAGKGDLPRAVKGEAFRAAYDNIKKPESWPLLIAKFHEAFNNKDSALAEELQARIKKHPFYTGKPWT
jgi:hypothetical protein